MKQTKAIPILRILLLTTLILVLILMAKELLPASSGLASQCILLAIAVIAVGLSFRLVMPEALLRLRSNPDLLMPLVCFVLFRVSTTFFLSHIAPHINGIAPLVHLLSQPGNFEIFNLFTEAIYATWVTLLLARLKRPPGFLPVASARQVTISFAAVLTSYLICVGALKLFIKLNLLALPYTEWMAPYLLMAGVLFWNLYTAAMVTESVHESFGYLRRLQSGFTHANSGMLRWTLPVLLQLILVGLVTYVSVKPLSHAAFDWISDSNQLHLHPMWFGGYSDICWWYYDRLSGVPSPQFITTLLSLVFGTLSVGVRLTVLQRTNPLSQTTISLANSRDDF